VFFVFVVLVHHRRRVVHFNVTEHPTAHWTAQQIVDAFPNDTAPSYLLRDRHHVYSEPFRHRVHDSSAAPAAMVDDYSALVNGEAVLQLPDGSRWVSIAALCSTDVLDTEGPRENVCLQRVAHDLWAHQALRGHRDPWLPAAMLNATTLDPTRVFCTDCRSWVDLAADDAEADRLEGERLVEPLEN
jgi:hypothetical protein